MKLRGHLHQRVDMAGNGKQSASSGFNRIRGALIHMDCTKDNRSRHGSSTISDR